VQKFTCNILVNLIQNEGHVNSFFLYCIIILKINHILEGVMTLNESGVHDI